MFEFLQFKSSTLAVWQTKDLKIYQGFLLNTTNLPTRWKVFWNHSTAVIKFIRPQYARAHARLNTR